jgi:hypothetical protein
VHGASNSILALATLVLNAFKSFTTKPMSAALLPGDPHLTKELSRCNVVLYSTISDYV